MHGVTTPLLLPREKLGTLSRDNRERASHALCSESPCGTTTHEKKAKSGKKQEGTNNRCPEGLSSESGPTPPRDVR